ncbi:nuclear transcription factor Y subunit beta-like isoform X1 [Branchiostoma floridae x Branchiostoma japonicum]
MDGGGEGQMDQSTDHTADDSGTLSMAVHLEGTPQGADGTQGLLTNDYSYVLDDSATGASANDSIASGGDDDGGHKDGDSLREHVGVEPLQEQDRFLPIHNISRIMRKAIPKKEKIAKDAKECVQECVSEFISFITSEASDRCHQEKRKTINGEDILFAMSTLGFDSYVEPLKLYLQKYRESMKGEKGGMNTSTTGAGDESLTSDLGADDSFTANIISTDGQTTMTYTYPTQVQVGRIPVLDMGQQLQFTGMSS